MIPAKTIRGSIHMLLLLPMCLFISHFRVAAQPAGYGYGKIVTVHSSQVSGTQTNFPVLIDVTDPNLRTQANGGRVRSASGNDILFTLADGSTVLTVQIERYVANTGEYVAWVKVPSISSAANTTLGMFYGKTGVANPSSTAVWDANYKGVWHFNNTVNDGTSNAKNLTNTSTTNFAGSKIGDGRQLDNMPFVTSAGACQYLKLPNGMIGGMSDFTFEGWVYLDDNTTSWERVFDFGQSATINMFLTPSMATNGVKRFSITTSGGGGEEQTSSTTTTAAAAWHQFAVTINNSTNTSVLYFDGAADASNTGVTKRPTDMATDNADYFGRSQYTADNCLSGKFDEFRISNTARSAGWIQTAYNNQNAPASFVTMSSEMTAPATMTTLPVALHSFEGTALPGGPVQLVWITEAERNNKTFLLERSADGNHWESFQNIPAGNGTGQQTYTVYDNTPYYPLSYYRLRQADIDGKETLLSVIAVRLSSALSDNISLYPNPGNDHVTVTLKNNAFAGAVKVKLTDYLGRVFNAPFSTAGNTLSMNTGGLPNGAYFLSISVNEKTYAQKLVIAR